MQANPYKNQADSLLAVALNTCMLGVFILCLVLRFNSLSDLDDIRSKMSARQIEVYASDEWILTAILTATLIVALVGSVVLSIMLIHQESIRRRQEDLSSKARRLRFISSQLSVPAPTITGGEPKHFHIFARERGRNPRRSAIGSEGP